MRVLLHTLDKIFRPLSLIDPDSRQEPALLKKLLKGDATWKTRKVILGWIIDTVEATLELPPHRQKRLQQVLTSIPPNQKRTSAKKWHRLLGELRSMTLAIPGSRGLFNVLQEVLKYNNRGHPSRIRLTKAVHQFLHDFSALETALATLPTRLAELVPQTPSVIGATDASGQGMGGVAFVHYNSGVRPLLWRHRFPPHVVWALVSCTNPAGTITNSKLELSGTVTHHGVLSSVYPLAEHTLHTFHNNTPSQFWQRKGSTTTSGPAAYLLRIQSHHQRQHRYVAYHDYLPGPLNTLADEASRLWSLNDSQLLAHFDSLYPQQKPWRLVPVPREILSSVISALAKKPRDVALFGAPSSVPTPTGGNGATIVQPWASTQNCPTSPTLFLFSGSSQPATAGAKDPLDNLYDLAQFWTRYGRWARRWPVWGPLTHAKTRLPPKSPIPRLHL